MFSALDILELAVEKHGLTLAEAALRWIVHHSSFKVTNGSCGNVVDLAVSVSCSLAWLISRKDPCPLRWSRVLIRHDILPKLMHGELRNEYDTLQWS
jgi:aflatoxin B1 aldehyde reductase